MAITQLTVRDLLLQTGLGSHRREHLMVGIEQEGLIETAPSKNRHAKPVAST